ncbi:putative maltase [Fusarium austroafricanum]|uniref:Putative maltase n=1 Tax=Fusarium austroafricanum TaxID=2364996 RepID=A0A8H4KWR1_9HYPO|nr:putative maltase [Fusarium austroafricanum]
MGSLNNIKRTCPGVDAIWVCPFYESPQVDFGYDISNYEAVHSDYGTMEDVETLITECHTRGLRVLFDLVINHTSDQYSWFLESRKSRTNPKRDCAQPDLNWESRALREAVYESAVRFWLRKGIDGFRVDTMTIYSKNPDFHMHPSPILTREFGDGKMTIGEFGTLSDTKLALDYVSGSKHRVSIGFQFETACIGYQLCQWHIKDFSLTDFKKSIEKWQKFIDGTDGWTCNFLENHDIARSVSRFCNDSPEYRATAAKALATLLATSTGTLFLYQGQEIGMTNIPKDWDIDEYKDILASNYWNEVYTDKKGDKAALAKAMQKIQAVARDHSRTPVQWNYGRHAGFTDAEDGPWMCVNDNYTEINVKQQVNDPQSVFSFWQNLLRLRKGYMDLFIYGTWKSLDLEDEFVMAYTKSYGSSMALVMLNFTAEDQDAKDRLPHLFQGIEPVITNVLGRQKDKLSAFEARIYIREMINGALE